jgi:ubiquinone/menaquinone biosynthesis C-methylase UbiE
MAEGIKKEAFKIFSGLSDRYDIFLDIFTFFQDRRWKREIVSLSDLRGKSVLELACGTCRLGSYIRGRRILIGIDINQKMLKNSGERKKLYDSILVADAEKLPFRERIFDAVIGCYIPKYVRASKIIDSSFYCMREEGVLLVYDFVWPEGLFSVLYTFYVGFLFRLFSLIAKCLRSGTQVTFKELPTIIRRTRWVLQLRKEAYCRNLRFSCKKLTFGTVYFVRVRRNP